MNKLYILIMALTLLLSGCGPSTEEIAAKARLEAELTFVKDELKKTEEELAELTFVKDELKKAEEKLAEMKQQLEAAQEIVNAIPKVTAIEGEVFISTQGAGSYTFSGVEIFAYDLDNYTTYFKNKKTELLEALEAYLEFKGAKFLCKSYQTADAKCNNLDEEWESLTYNDPRKDLAWEKLNAAWDVRDNISDKVRSLCVGYIDLLNLHLPDFIATDLPLIAQSRSDSKGVFELEIPKGKSLAVVASATRLHDKRTEKYYWVAATEPKNKSAIKLFLDNDKLIVLDSNPYNIAPLSPNDGTFDDLFRIIDAFM